MKIKSILILVLVAGVDARLLDFQPSLHYNVGAKNEGL
jgi:hypothetical protein